MKFIWIFLIAFAGIMVRSSQAYSDPGLIGIEGYIVDDHGPVPYATIYIGGLSTGTLSDESGFFSIELPINRKFDLQVSHVGYMTEKITVSAKTTLDNSYTIRLKPSLNELSEMVVTGTRTEKDLENSAISVAVLDRRTMERTHSVNLAEGLNFTSGMRVEVDCQTCNYTQLRINGLGGAYSQFLINSRPVFSSLAGLYGLEQISTNMIEKVEIVKGGGSALFGSNAIGGTVNIITREPGQNDLAIGIETGVIGGSALDLNLGGNYSTKFKKGGITLFMNGRKRESYDHNNDGFSELPLLKNLNGGFNAVLRPSALHQVNLNFFKIDEYRRGGNQLDRPAHETDQAEERYHDIYTGGVDYTIKLPEVNSNINFYTAGQLINREHYTGIDGVDAYGTTRNYSLNAGVQGNYYLKSHTFSAGFDYQFEDVLDVIPFYQYKVDQTTHLKGLFLQADLALTPSLMMLAGMRVDEHNMVNKTIFNPRISIMYEPLPGLKIRSSYGTGFRAPQAFDADMHIALSGGGISLIQLDPGLKEERSTSYLASIAFDNPKSHYIYGFTLEGFYTGLSDPFILEEDVAPDQQTLLIKRNGGDARVAGLTLESRLNYRYIIEFEAGVTWQRSWYDQEVKWSMDIPGEKKFLRSPETYGFFTLQWNPTEKTHINFSGILTGAMLVPHFGGAPGVTEDRLKVTPFFWDQDIRITRDIPVFKKKYMLEVSMGIENVFNAYQDDFDVGRFRDSNYVYGPPEPRSIFAGIKIGSIR